MNVFLKFFYIPPDRYATSGSQALIRSFRFQLLLFSPLPIFIQLHPLNTAGPFHESTNSVLGMPYLVSLRCFEALSLLSSVNPFIYLSSFLKLHSPKPQATSQPVVQTTSVKQLGYRVGTAFHLQPLVDLSSAKALCTAADAKACSWMYSQHYPMQWFTPLPCMNCVCSEVSQVSGGCIFQMTSVCGGTAALQRTLPAVVEETLKTFQRTSRIPKLHLNTTGTE